MVVAFVSKSHRFGSHLNPIIGFSVKIGEQSGLLVIMFQFLWINLFDVGVRRIVICNHSNVIYLITTNIYLSATNIMWVKRHKPLEKEYMNTSQLFKKMGKSHQYHDTVDTSKVMDITTNTCSSVC